MGNKKNFFDFLTVQPVWKKLTECVLSKFVHQKYYVYNRFNYFKYVEKNTADQKQEILFKNQNEGKKNQLWLKLAKIICNKFLLSKRWRLMNQLECFEHWKNNLQLV
jgi:hypothetical protein